MAYAVIAEVPGGTLDQYKAMGEAMGFQGDEEKSAGLLVHFAGIESGTLIVVDVWESREAYQRHLADVPSLSSVRQTRSTLPPYTHREFELHNLVR